jgi:hypothetical protein
MQPSVKLRTRRNQKKMCENDGLQEEGHEATKTGRVKA